MELTVHVFNSGAALSFCLRGLRASLMKCVPGRGEQGRAVSVLTC